LAPVADARVGHRRRVPHPGLRLWPPRPAPRALAAHACIPQRFRRSSPPHPDRRKTMHAVTVKVSIVDRERAERELHERVVPMVSQAPGFVAGYWLEPEDE